jgi:hypothetical protein
MSAKGTVTPVLAAQKAATAAGARGESAIDRPSPRNALKDTHEHSCYRARPDKHQRLMVNGRPWLGGGGARAGGARGLQRDRQVPAGARR